LFSTLAVSSLAIVTFSGVAGAAGSEALAKLCDSYWQGQLEASPTWATQLGDKRYDDRLDDNTPAGIAKDQERLEGVLAAANAIDSGPLSEHDRLVRTALIASIQRQLDTISCHMEDWVVDPLGGPQVWFMSLADYTQIGTPQDGANYVKRVGAMGHYLDAHIANLTTGLAKGRTATQDGVRKVIDQLDRLNQSKAESLAVFKPALAERKGWSAAERETFSKNLRAAVETSLKPSLVRYHDFLVAKIQPAARPSEKAGLASMPGGADAYRKLIRVTTSLDMTPEEIHKLGLAQVAEFRRDLAALGQKVFGTSDVAEIQKRLRTSPEMHFKTSDEVEAKARETLARAKAAVPNWFGKVQPKADCVVKVMGMYEAPYSTIAYYRPPSADGSRPGQYMINTYLPETRPRYEAEALAFHESIPGHHLQIAVANELTGVPEFMKHEGVTAFVEGWGLYSERLADEMGLYTSDVDRLGKLSLDAWRSCRLVVDTGMHAMGWSRQQAIDYMVENTALAQNNIENEVDRYLTWPGQALAYKLGQGEILKLRDEAKTRLGTRFDIKAFHDVVLGNGAVALPVLREQVEAYIAAAGKAN
jgi:uncharacterized protein (DUF885 family)